MVTFRIGEASSLLGVSADTLRRWADDGRVVSLLSREAADELGLEPGMLAVAAIKSTSVSVEIPGTRPKRRPSSLGIGEARRAG